MPSDCCKALPSPKLDILRHRLGFGYLGFQDINFKRRTLLLCLLYEAQVNTRDYLVDMFIKRILKIQNNAKQRLQELRDKHLTETSELLTTFGQVKASTKPKKLRIMLFFGEQVQSILDEHGGTELLLQKLDEIAAYQQSFTVDVAVLFCQSQSTFQFGAFSRYSLNFC